MTVKCHAAATGQIQAGDNVEEGGLAGTVRPQQTEDFTVEYRQIKRIEGGQTTETHRQTCGLQQWRWCKFCNRCAAHDFVFPGK